MAKKKVVMFCAADQNNMKYYERFKNSLRKFHSEEELPLLLWDQAKIESYNDPNFFYRHKPIIARQLLKDYELVIGADVDQIITGSLTPLLENTGYDMAAPLNWNQVDQPVSVVDIPPTMYFNCGLVAMRSREFVEKWFNLCHSYHFNSYQFREQDLLNIMAYYFDFKFKNLDEDDSWYGLISKGRWSNLKLENGQLVCPPMSDKFPNKKMVVRVLHWGGGNVQGDKFDVIGTRFTPEVQDFLRSLIK